MNKRLLPFMVAAFVFAVTTSVAQAQSTAQQEGEGLNLVKFNVLPLLGGKFAFEYERLLTDRISVGAAVSLRPSQKLPFSSTVKSIVDEDEVNQVLDNFRSSNFSITPEARFYTSKRGTFRGFYVAPYVKFASFGVKLPYEVEVDPGNEESIDLSGKVTSFTAGVSVGVNFKLTEKFYLDWRIVGPGYGTAKGDISGRMNLSDPDVRDAFEEGLNDLKADLEELPLSIKIDPTVTSEGADVKILRSPWAAIRTGLSISYRF